MFAAAAAGFLSLFGAHQIPPHTALLAAASAPIQQTISTIAPAAVATSSVTSPIVASTPDLTDYVTKAELSVALDQRFAALSALVPALQQLITKFPAAQTTPNTVFFPSYSTSGSSGVLTTANWAASQRIDNLSGTTLNNVTVHGMSGLTMNDIPDLSGSYLSIMSSSTARSTIGLSYATGADVVNNTSIAAWGDSLTFGTAQTNYPGTLSSLTTKYVYNGGVPGDTSTEISARMLADPAKHVWPTIIWAGRNNFSDSSTVESDVASMVAALQAAGNTKYLILGILNGAGEPSGSTNYIKITSINNHLATAYGNHFLDVLRYLVQFALGDAGVTPTGQDLTDISNDIPPTSLRADGVHPNDRGYRVIAQYLYENIDLLETSNQSPLTINSLHDVFSRSLNVKGFINTDQYSGFQQNGATILYASTTNGSLAVGAPQAAAWMAATSSLLYNTAVGRGALAAMPTTGIAANNSAFGALALFSNTAGYQNSAFGSTALQVNTTGNNNSAFGYGALTRNTTGFHNVAVGAYALFENTSGTYNSAVGMYSLQNNTTGIQNTAQGYSALNKNTTGSNNVASGKSSLFSNTTGSDNSAVGAAALNANTTGSQNTAVGRFALYNNASATSSTVVGYQAAFGNATYSNQGGVYYGFQSGYSAATGSDFNTLIGYQAGYGITTGSNNIWLGTATSSTGIANLTTGSQNILIGNNISFASTTANGQLNIGNILFGTGITSTGSTLSSGSLGVGTTSPWRKFSVTGTVGLANLTAGTGAGSLCLSSTNEVTYSAGAGCTGSSLRFKHDIVSLDASSSLDTVLKLNPVSFAYNDDIGVKGPQVGLIAEEVLQADPRLVATDASSTPFTVKYENLTAILAGAIQQMWKTVAGFAQSFTSRRITASEQLCVGSTCVTESQLQELLERQNVTPPTSTEGEVDDTDDTPQAPPIIEILGNNPATVDVGAVYSDLGARIIGPQEDINLGIHTFVGSTPIEYAVIDTSAPATYHIYYVVIGTSGLTSTSTRTVIVEQQPTPSVVNAASSTTVATSTSQ